MTQPDAATPTHDPNGGVSATGAAGPTAAEGGPTAAEGGPDAGGIGSMLYKLALAGVGALILAQEEIEAAWKRTRGERQEGESEGGEQAATEGGGAAHEAEGAATTPPSPGAPDGTRVWNQIDAAIARVLRTLSIPAREDVDAVADKLEALAARIEARSRR